MSYRSQCEINIRKNGYISGEYSHIKWLGSIDKCWNYYVEKYNSKIKKGSHQVYMMSCVIHDIKYIKIGISSNSINRLNSQKVNFPVGEWSLDKVVYVTDKYRAENCEFAMLVACSHLNINGEWIKET